MKKGSPPVLPGVSPSFFEAVYRVVRTVPKGRLMTYGQIATLLGHPRAARAVGYALRASGNLPDVPWQRVINGKGQISAKNEVERPLLQRVLLEAEGIRFDEEESCDLECYRWTPLDPEAFGVELSRELPFR